jgi:ABC-2 type transport system ATP-binding protein
LVDIFNGEILNKGKYIRDLSKGNQSKVGVAACLIRDPQLLILDEPFANIDPSTQIRLKNIFKNLSSSQKVTIIISSHDLTHVTDICDRILLMEKGRIVKDIVTSATTLADLQSYFSI